jgi:hypothetical protein
VATPYFSAKVALPATLPPINMLIWLRGGFAFRSALPLFELALVLVDPDQVASRVVTVHAR